MDSDRDPNEILNTFKEISESNADSGFEDMKCFFTFIGSQRLANPTYFAWNADADLIMIK